MDEGVQQLVDFLQAMATMIRTHINSDLEYAGNTEVVLRHGRVFSNFVDEVPEDEQYSKAKECFYNAFMIAIDKAWTYVEGYGYDPEIFLPIHHAWLANAAGQVYDPTWGHREGAVYLGVPLKWEYVYEHSMHGDLMFSIFCERFDYKSPLPADAIVQVGDPL